MKRKPEGCVRLTASRKTKVAGEAPALPQTALGRTIRGFRGPRRPKGRLGLWTATILILGMPLALAAQDVPPPKGTVLDEIIAHVNDDIITSNQYDQAKQSLLEGIKHDCPSCTPEQIQAQYQKQGKSVLSQMISNDLLVQRAKDQGINVDADVIKEEDRQRQQYHLDSIEALRRAVEASGMSWADFEDQIRQAYLRNEVIQQDVGGMIQIDHTEVQKYYDAHKQEFNSPEEVQLREIFLSTTGKTPAEIAAIKQKAENIRQQILNGQDFAKLAKLYSQDLTAQEGGELGFFTRDKLKQPVEAAVFALPRNGITPVLDLGNGFGIYQVEQHYQAGIQPLDAVEPQIEDALYRQKIGPVLQDFLKQLREQSYIQIAPGYTDDMAVTETAIEEVTPGADDASGKKAKKKKKSSPADAGNGDTE